MFFLNLSLGEFFTLLAGLGGLITALYLLDRSKRKKVVSTLRFWAPARTAEELQSRRRMRDPWSLILQLVGLLLLLLAIAQLQWGSKSWRGHDHVLLLDTSAWSASGSVLNDEKKSALAYLAALPGVDRMMLVRVDGLATPVTPFSNNRAELRKAILESNPQSSSLNLEQALAFATQAQKWTEGVPGEIVYVGPSLVSSDPPIAAVPSNLRLLPVESNHEHVGIRHIEAKRDPNESNTWDATVTLKNFGAQSETVRLRTRFANATFAPRSLSLAPHQEAAADYRFVTGTAGDLVAQVDSSDSLKTDQQVRLGLPRSGPLEVAVYTDRAAELRPLLEANHRLVAHFYPTSQYPASSAASQVLVLDGFKPRSAPTIPSLWIHPPRDGSPIAVKGVDYDAVIKFWRNDNVLGAGLHAKDDHIVNAEIFEKLDDDIPVANVAGGPIVIARNAHGKQPRFGIIGFDPLEGQLKFEVTTPVLFANFLRWLSPESFRSFDLSAASVGAESIKLDPNERTDNVRVVDDKGAASPFTIRSGMLQLYTAEPSVLHIYSADRERILSLTLPEVAETEWKAPNTVPQGIPRFSRSRSLPVDLWKALALAGLGCLLAEWLLFGRQRRARSLLSKQKPVAQAEPELAAK